MPLKHPLTNGQIDEVKVKCYHSATNVREACIISFDCPLPFNKELLLRSHHDFVNNTGDDALHCKNGDCYFSSFRQVFGATQKTSGTLLQLRILLREPWQNSRHHP